MFNWVLTFHVAFVVAWFAGLFYLPRLFVYHCETRDRVGRDRFCLMEKRLSRLMSIAAVGAVLCGIWLITLLGSGWLAATDWFHAKLALVVLLIGFHGWCQIQTKKFREDRATGNSRYYRMMNEIPSVLLILILILVFVRPF